MARSGGGDPQQPDQRAGRQQGDRHASRQARRDLGPEAAGHLDGVAELADRRQRGLGRRQPGGAVRVDGVQEPGAQFDHDAGPGPRRSWQPRGDLGQIVLDRWSSIWFWRP